MNIGVALELAAQALMLTRRAIKSYHLGVFFRNASCVEHKYRRVILWQPYIK